MSNQLERLASCEQITEWVKPNEDRFVNVFGQVPKVSWKMLRQDWEVNWSEYFRDQSIYDRWLSPIKRLLVPAAMHSTTKIWLGPNGHERGQMGINFESTDDWAKCMPIDEATQIPIPADERMRKFHMAVALCGKSAGLTVISREFEDEENGVYQDFSVHPVADASLFGLARNSSAR